MTAVNELGESPLSAAVSIANSAGDFNVLTLTVAGTNARYYNVYRSNAGAAAATAKFIGRTSTTATGAIFTDLNNKSPGFVTGFLLQKDTFCMKELAPYSRMKLAVTDLSLPEAFFRFTTLAVFQPRKNVLLDNLRGSF
jgi:hypothetical protein